MKFIVSSSNLLKNLQSIMGVITTKSPLPILEDFLFEINKSGKLTVFATDLEISMIAEVAVETKDSGRIAIPARLLVDTLKSLPEQPIVFTVDDKTKAIELSSETGKYKMAGSDAEDYPKVPIADKVTELSIQSSVLSRIISKGFFAISTDELRPAMTGMLFEITREGLTFVATDAHSLVKLVRKDIKAREETQFIVPRKALRLLKSAIGAKDEAGSISYNKSNAFFTFGNLQLICRLVDANYPDYKAVIPTNNPNRLTISRLEFLNSLRRISLYTNNTTGLTVFQIAGSELKISANDMDFGKEAAERMTCEYEGEDLEIGFNARLVMEMLGVLDSAEVKGCFATPTRAGVFEPVEKEDGEELQILIMPTMVSK